MKPYFLMTVISFCRTSFKGLSFGGRGAGGGGGALLLSAFLDCNTNLVDFRGGRISFIPERVCLEADVASGDSG
jgi:hypothetical protein